MLDHRRLAFAGAVFGALDRAHERAGSSGHDALHLLGGGAEGGRTFRGVEHAQTSAGAGAHVEESPALAEARHDEIDRTRDGRQLAGHRVRNAAVLGGDAFEDSLDVEGVEIERARIALLGGETGEFVEAGAIVHA